MENALLISLSHQTALKRRMEMIANNMANMNTAGFKSDSLMFEEFVMPVARVAGMQGASARLSYVQDRGAVRDFSPGPLEQSGNELDVAINGDGWFAVETPEGERYTRNGQFRLDNQGRLVTGEGFPVLGDGGPVDFTNDETGIEIARDGTVSTSEGRKDRLRIVRFENLNGMTKVGASLFASTAPAQPAPGAMLAQGMVEKSNVQPVQELTRMIETLRAYTQSVQALEATHNLRRNAIEQLGGTTQA